MSIWRILFFVSLAATILLYLCLKIFKPIKNIYYHAREEDELLKRNKHNEVIDYVYSTSNQTRKYIKRYAISKTRSDCCVICNYNQSFNTITYFVIGYNKRGKVVDVVNVNEANTTNTSKIIGLNKKVRTVNVVIRKANDEVISTQLIRPLSKSRIQIYSILTTFFVFSLLFTLRHLAIEASCFYYVDYFMNHLYNYISVGVILVISLIYYFLCLFKHRKKNLKNRNGGSLEYEFF